VGTRPHAGFDVKGKNKKKSGSSQKKKNKNGERGVKGKKKKKKGRYITSNPPKKPNPRMKTGAVWVKGCLEQGMGKKKGEREIQQGGGGGAFFGNNNPTPHRKNGTG